MRRNSRQTIGPSSAVASAISAICCSSSATGGRAGRAEAKYTVTRSGASPITGRLVLGVIRRDGKPKIDLIATEPRG